MVQTSLPWRASTFMSEYSPLPATARSKLVRAELEEPWTRNRTGRRGSPGCGAPMRLRQRLRFTSPLASPFLAQYSALQIGALSAGAEVLASAPAIAVEGNLLTNPAPAPSPAPLSSVRRAMA